MEDSLSKSIDKIQKTKNLESNNLPNPIKAVSELEEAVRQIAELQKASK
jgi:hypothetical protein